jgi:5'-3' exonuclease
MDCERAHARNSVQEDLQSIEIKGCFLSYIISRHWSSLPLSLHKEFWELFISHFSDFIRITYKVKCPTILLYFFMYFFRGNTFIVPLPGYKIRDHLTEPLSCNDCRDIHKEIQSNWENFLECAVNMCSHAMIFINLIKTSQCIQTFMSSGEKHT